MIKHKRIVGSIIVKDNWAVQSFGYKKYFPLGRPEVIAQNLDRWGVDEIFINCIDRYNRGPNIPLIAKIANYGITTPIIYSGGIKNKTDAINVISNGADRISIDGALHENIQSVVEISKFIGQQALLASLPITFINDKIFWYDYIKRINKPFPYDLLEQIGQNAFSEIVIIDWFREGSVKESFNEDILKKLSFINCGLILFGGVKNPLIAERLISNKKVSALIVGNYFSYKEHAVQNYKSQIKQDFLRKENYQYLKIGYTYYDSD